MVISVTLAARGLVWPQRHGLPGTSRDFATSADFTSALSMNRCTGRSRRTRCDRPQYQTISGLPQCSQSRSTCSRGCTAGRRRRRRRNAPSSAPAGSATAARSSGRWVWPTSHLRRRDRGRGRSAGPSSSTRSATGTPRIAHVRSSSRLATSDVTYPPIERAFSPIGAPGPWPGSRTAGGGHPTPPGRRSARRRGRPHRETPCPSAPPAPGAVHGMDG